MVRFMLYTSASVAFMKFSKYGSSGILNAVGKVGRIQTARALESESPNILVRVPLGKLRAIPVTVTTSCVGQEDLGKLNECSELSPDTIDAS